MQEFLLAMLLFGLVWAVLGWWLSKVIERALRTKNYREGFALVTFWPLFGRMPLGNLRMLQRLRRPMLLLFTVVPVLIGVMGLLIAFSDPSDAATELRIIFLVAPIFFIATVWYWMWILDRGIRRGGGLPLRK